MTNNTNTNINEEIKNIINLDEEKNCPKCEKPSTIGDLNRWCGQCWDCDHKENHADDDGPCERCGSGVQWFCEEDCEYGDHKLFVSNTDGKNICRHCIAIEDAGEDWECPYECGLCEEKDKEEEGYCWKHEVAILPCEDCVNGVKCDDWEEAKGK